MMKGDVMSRNKKMIGFAVLGAAVASAVGVNEVSAQSEVSWNETIKSMDYKAEINVNSESRWLGANTLNDLSFGISYETETNDYDSSAWAEATSFSGTEVAWKETPASDYGDELLSDYTLAELPGTYSLDVLKPSVAAVQPVVASVAYDDVPSIADAPAGPVYESTLPIFASAFSPLPDLGFGEKLWNFLKTPVLDTQWDFTDPMKPLVDFTLNDSMKFWK